jgi:SAM-dependent methyltransferase
LLYDSNYAAEYARLYIAPWRRKHERNVANLRRLLGQLAIGSRPPRWLDLACGPAWHFAQFPEAITRVGLDASLAQLRHAREANPQASFVCADMARSVLAPASFDLVTHFWAGYCYQDDEARIAALLENIVAWTRPGGACYLEVLLPGDVATFNASGYARATGFRVFARTPDFVRWGYLDSGGRHEMMSPPLEFFTALLAPAFAQLEAEHDGAFMVHLIATGRKA